MGWGGVGLVVRVLGRFYLSAVREVRVFVVLCLCIGRALR